MVDTARAVEGVVREEGAEPATIAVLDGASLRTNIALIKNNARLAARIAVALDAGPS